MAPQSRRKTLFLVRHGVAQHNIPHESIDITHPKWTDPPLLDPQGSVQAREAGHRICSYLATTKLGANEKGLVVSSPLSRCLRTAQLAFFSHDGGSKIDSPEFLCHEGVREACGIHYTDRRRGLSDLKSVWPNVTFHQSVTERDELWRPDIRETIYDVTNRSISFLNWLVNYREEDVVVVVSHGVWIECLLMQMCPYVLDFGRKRVHNCDVFLGTLVWEEDGGKVCSSIKLEDAKQL